MATDIPAETRIILGLWRDAERECALLRGALDRISMAADTFLARPTDDVAFAAGILAEAMLVGDDGLLDALAEAEPALHPDLGSSAADRQIATEIDANGCTCEKADPNPNGTCSRADYNLGGEGGAPVLYETGCPRCGVLPFAIAYERPDYWCRQCVRGDGVTCCEAECQPYFVEVFVRS
jgi:hypothetical protein